jgi:uncharacterized membrane protein (DUF2068 family)
MVGGGGGGDTAIGPKAPLDRPRDVGVRVIITYKLVKAALQAGLAAALPVLRQLGVTTYWAARASRIAEHVAHRWTAVLARRIAALLTPTHVTLIALALAMDAALSAVEGWALHRRFRWAPWLVVVAGSTLVPFEVIELARRPRPSRIAILVVNLVIIAYLAARARREHVEARARR